jgi:molybdopterin-guanine dinucleotide biosynthesis protein A
MTGIVLSGGENRRMGAEKAFLKIAGKPMIEYVLTVLRSVAGRIIIVTNAPQSYAAYDACVVSDALGKRGPLTGIYSGLLHSQDEYNIVVACDMPFLNSRLISHMAELAGDEYDVVLPKIGEFVEPLHAVYRRGLLPLIEEHIRKDVRQIKRLFTEVRVRYVTEAEIDFFDPERISLKNINTPEEYKEVACSELDCRSY